jgi:RNA polymerase sigma-70 factor (ECF subfamily)
MLGGLTTAEISHAFLVPEPTMAQRLSRAKGKIRAAGIPFRIPDLDDLPARLASVLGVVYLVFNEGYSASGGNELTRTELCDEAIRLGRVLVELLPSQSETLGLLSLMLLIDARRAARTDAAGAFVQLAAQDRDLWNSPQMEEGRELLRVCVQRNEPGPYQIQAAINAVHSEARASADTDWSRILALYDKLYALMPNKVVALNRAVVVGEISGPSAALRLIEELDLTQYHLYHAVRADFLRRLGRDADAAQAYGEAIGLCGNAREREFLERQYLAIARN